jgi:hypothetical protein
VHVVAARLGRTNPAITLRVYSHVLREHSLSIGDVFARAIRPETTGRSGLQLANPLAGQITGD